MNKIIIDGYNMIHRVPDLCKFLDESLEKARNELILQLKSYLMRSKVEITLVFDGNQPVFGSDASNSHKYLRIIFSKYPFKADPLIKDLIKREQKKKSLILVSDDADIIQHAKSHGSKVLSPVAFYQRIEGRFHGKELNNKFDQEMTEEELSKWLEIFGIK